MAMVSPIGRTEWQLTRPVELGCVALCVGQAVYLAAAFMQGNWLADPAGAPIATDFVNVWAAGRQALSGAPAAVYDVAVHKAAEAAAVGHDFAGEYPWLYPPFFLFVAGLLALLPHVTAAATWLALTFPAYVMVFRSIVRHRAGVLLACAYPGLLANAVVGQNGFLTAALLGGALLLLERSPLAAGGLIGLMAFKPHLGILIPVALVAGGHWRAFAAATVTVVLLALLSLGAFGLDPWLAFFQGLPTASQSTLEQGRAEWGKLQSAYGVVRMAGGASALAWTVQGVLAGAVTIALAALWRSKAPFELKAAALATGTLLVTPYMFLYDLVILAVAMAFLLRGNWGQTPISASPAPGELGGLALAGLLIVIFPLVKAPLGFVAALVVALLIARRLERGDRPQISRQVSHQISAPCIWRDPPLR
jgi:arabinofuranan 3-O-arabinosyltransferase